MRLGSNTIFAALFVAVCVLPLAGLVAPGLDGFADLNEKREMAAAPDPGALPPSALPAATEAWFNDHFGFRGLLVRLHGWWQYRMFNASSSPQVLPGRDGWLFYDGKGVRGGDPRRNHLAQLPRQHERMFSELRGQFEHNRDWFAARGITYLVVIVPDKWSVYAEQLPGSVGPAPERTSGDLFLDHMREFSDVPILDLKAPLRAQRQTYGPLYHRIDSHWNDLGAWLAARAIADFAREFDPRVGEAGPVDPAPAWRERRYGDLAALLGLEGWLSEQEPWVDRSGAAELQVTRLPAPANAAMSRRFPQQVVNPHGSGRPRLLIMRDSYGDALLPWLGQAFGDSRWLWTSNVRRYDISPVLDEVRPDIVIEEKAEKYLMFPIRYYTAPGRSAVVAPRAPKNRR